MMISLGYYFDQVSRERMTQRISERVELIAASTPTDTPVGRTDVLWIETAHPVYHELTIDLERSATGRSRTPTNLPYLDLGDAERSGPARDGHGHGRRSDAVRARSGDSRRPR